MANEITFGYITGRSLTYGVYQPDGTVRTAAGTALSEVAGTGYYVATNGDITAGDFVIIRDVTGGGSFECGQGQYKPEVSASDITADLAAIDAKVDILDTNVDLLLTHEQTVNTEDPVSVPVETKARIYL